MSRKALSSTIDGVGPRPGMVTVLHHFCDFPIYFLVLSMA